MGWLWCWCSPVGPGSHDLNPFVVLWLLGKQQGFSLVGKGYPLWELASQEVAGKELLEKTPSLPNCLAEAADPIWDISALLASTRTDEPLSWAGSGCKLWRVERTLSSAPAFCGGLSYCALKNSLRVSGCHYPRSSFPLRKLLPTSITKKLKQIKEMENCFPKLAHPHK